METWNKGDSGIYVHTFRLAVSIQYLLVAFSCIFFIGMYVAEQVIEASVEYGDLTI